MRNFTHVKLTALVLALGIVFLLGVSSAMAAVDTTKESALEAYAVVGHKVRVDGGSNNNYYGNAKVRYRPSAWQNNVSETRVDLGIFGTLQQGAGEAGSSLSDYRWTKTGVGVTTRISTDQYWYLKLDIGLGYLSSMSDADKSTDYLLITAADYRLEQRRAVGKNFLPSVDVHAGYERALSSTRSSKAGKNLVTNENGSSVLLVTPTLVDIPLTPGHVVSLAVIGGVGQTGVKTELQGDYQYGGQLEYRYKGNLTIDLTGTHKEISGGLQENRYIASVSYSF